MKKRDSEKWHPSVYLVEFPCNWMLSTTYKKSIWLIKQHSFGPDLIPLRLLFEGDNLRGAGGQTFILLAGE